MKKILEAIDAERWGEYDVCIVGERGEFKGLVGEPERRAHDECLDRIKATVSTEAAKNMKLYCDGRPEKPGWYWYYWARDDAQAPEPVYFDGFGWFESYNRLIRYVTPHFWLEMEPPSAPEGEA